MLAFLAAFLLLCLVGVRFSSFHRDYMEPEQTGCVKGFFAMIILFSHAASYITPGGRGDELYIYLLNHLGQLMVTMFLFYSGYGVLQAFRRRGDYAKGFFRRRFLRTLVHFDLAVLLYLLLSFALGTRYSLAEYLLCWTGWLSIGNSNWFIFVMLALYLLTLAALLLAGKGRGRLAVACVAVTLLSVGLWLLLRHYKMPHWYNTLLCYPLGMWYALGKEKIDALLRKRWLSLGALAVVFVPFAVLYLRLRWVQTWYSLCACLFVLLGAMVTSKMKVGNPVLQWLGVHAFSIYILQRLPMLVFQRLGLTQYPALFLALSILAALPLAWAFQRLLDALDRRAFR